VVALPRSLSGCRCRLGPGPAVVDDGFVVGVWAAFGSVEAAVGVAGGQERCLCRVVAGDVEAEDARVGGWCDDDYGSVSVGSQLCFVTCSPPVLTG
jgi:hypothetical protein